MSEAHDSGEWQRLAELDRECQLTIKQVISEDPRAMFDELREMLGFYAALIGQCQKQKEGFAKEVRQLKRSRLQENTYAKLQRMS